MPESNQASLEGKGEPACETRLFIVHRYSYCSLFSLNLERFVLFPHRPQCWGEEAAGHASPRDLWIDRAILRHSRREYGGDVPAVAGPGADAPAARDGCGKGLLPRGWYIEQVVGVGGIYRSIVVFVSALKRYSLRCHRFCGVCPLLSPGVTSIYDEVYRSLGCYY